MWFSFVLSSVVPADLEVLPCCGYDVALVGRPIDRQAGGSRIVSCPTVPGISLYVLIK